MVWSQTSHYIHSLLQSTTTVRMDGVSTMEDLCHGLASNESLHTLTLTINNYSATDVKSGWSIWIVVWRQTFHYVHVHSLLQSTTTVPWVKSGWSIWVVVWRQTFHYVHSLLQSTTTVPQDEVWMEYLGRGLASNFSLRTLTLTVSYFSEKDIFSTVNQ